jgi:hypothetical protein
MVKLKRRVVRECTRTFRRRRPVVVGLEPGDVLTFRVKGTRERYTLTIGEAMYHAARLLVAFPRRRT